jgi:hypothetical protein
MQQHSILNRLGKTGLSVLVALVVAGLVACGGGGSVDGSVVPTPPVDIPTPPVGNLNLVLPVPNLPGVPDYLSNLILGPMTVDTIGNVYVASYYGLDQQQGAGFYTFKPNAPVLSRFASRDVWFDFPWIGMVAVEDALYVASMGYPCQLCGSKPVAELLKVSRAAGIEVLRMGPGGNTLYESIQFRITGLDRDSEGNFFLSKVWWIPNNAHGEVLKYTPAGVLTSVAKLPNPLWAIKVARDGVLYVASCATDSCSVLKVAADGSASPFGTAKFANISSLALDGKGNVYVADKGMHTVHKITAQGVVSTIAGVAGKANAAVGPLPASLSDPNNLSYSPSDNKLYLISGGSIVSIDLPN